MAYKESHASAHVNVRERLFHCKVCGEGLTEASFIAKLYGTTYGNATRIENGFKNQEDITMWDAEMQLSAGAKNLLHNFNITDDVIDELKIRSDATGGSDPIFPVFFLGHLMDVRTYSPGNTPKMRSRLGSMPGLIIPYDIWKESPKTRTTLICAGEKDMATTRSHGFNAITITGGENILPAVTTEFQDRDIVILYDNDDAGKKGAFKLAQELLPLCRSVKICFKFHEVCVEDKEDMTDYWNKYNGTREQLIQFMDATKPFTLADIPEKITKFVTLEQATKPENLNKILRSNVQVVATSDVQYAVPTAAIGTKFKSDDATQGQSMIEGEVRDWELSEANLSDMLHLVDNGFTDDDIRKNLKAFMKISAKERNVKVEVRKKEIVYKGYVTDMFESMRTDNLPMEYTVYSLGARLESGKKYTCTYKIVTHPYKGQQLIMLITNAVPANDSVSNFKVTAETVKNLSVFQRPDLNVKEQVNDCVQRVKGLLGYDGNDTLIKIMDLAYHTVLAFNFGRFTNVRGYLDTIIVGESRVGKSSTAEALRNAYQVGVFTSLAGNSATIPGLIGGSNKTSSGSMQTKAGLIPQNHKGLIIFEEFGKCNNGLVTELTDIRSSNEVRITRVSGTLSLPAMVRMISLSNVKSFNGEIKSIASYPGGIQLITELVPTAEDIARYDIMCILGDRGARNIDPLWEPLSPYPDKSYQDRVRWVWSRTPEEIFISPDVAKFIVECANELNKDFDCHIKIFGTEAWKKLARLSIAVAGYCVSTDSSYQNIIVKKEHVQYAVETMCELYDNDVFRLREYVNEERKYSEVTTASTEALQQLYAKSPQLLLTLTQEARPTKSTLMAASGTAADDYNALMSVLIRHSFVRLSGMDVLPTEKFRKSMREINTNISLKKLGET